jgi:hypothetical protein
VNNRVPWVLQLLWHPPEALDLVDGEGRIDHGKVLPALCLIWLLLLVTLDRAPDVWVMIVLVSASYGYGSWRTFLMSKTLTRTETRQEVYTETVKRGETLGVQPSP